MLGNELKSCMLDWQRLWFTTFEWAKSCRCKNKHISLSAFWFRLASNVDMRLWRGARRKNLVSDGAKMQLNFREPNAIIFPAARRHKHSHSGRFPSKWERRGRSGWRAAFISSITQIPAGIVLVDVRTSFHAPTVKSRSAGVCLVLSVRAKLSRSCWQFDTKKAGNCLKESLGGSGASKRIPFRVTDCNKSHAKPSTLADLVLQRCGAMPKQTLTWASKLVIHICTRAT